MIASTSRTNNYLKFRLLADYTDCSVGVAEDVQGGFLVDQGHFTALKEYFTETHVYKREDDSLDADAVDTSIDIVNRYSGMQTAIFKILDDAGHLC